MVNKNHTATNDGTSVSITGC